MADTKEMMDAIYDADKKARENNPSFKKIVDEIGALNSMADNASAGGLYGTIREAEAILDQIRRVSEAIDAYFGGKENRDEEPTPEEIEQDELLKDIQEDLEDFESEVEDKIEELEEENELDEENPEEENELDADTPERTTENPERQEEELDLPEENELAQKGPEAELIQNTKNYYQNQVQTNEGLEQFTAKGAFEAVKEMENLSAKQTADGFLTKEDMDSFRKQMAAVTLHEMLNGEKGDMIRKAITDPETGEINMENYRKNLTKIAESPEFKNLYPDKMKPEDVKNVLTDLDGMKKTGEKLQENILQNARENRAQNSREMDENAPRRHANTVHTNRNNGNEHQQQRNLGM